MGTAIKTNSGLKSILKSIWKSVNIFDIPQLTRDISSDVKHIRNCYDNSKKAIEDYKEELKKEREARVKEQNLFVSVLDHLDDMVWAKDLEGRYIVANKAFREKFCYGLSWDELQGKNDLELALLFKRKVGHENHTFGEVCANSDVVIQETEEAKQFLEYGKINGSVMKLVVNKSPVYNYSGDMFATCGTGRNVTEWHDALEEAILKVKDGCSCFGQEETEILLRELNRLKFEEGDHVSVR
jgi:PAS domain S-box-containing protein